MKYLAESDLKARVERRREEAPGSQALATAIYAYVETMWFEPAVAEPLIREALAISEKNGDRLGVARAQTALAESIFIRTQYKESLPLVAEAIPILIEHGATKEYCWCLLLLGAVSQSTGAYDSGLEQCFKALELTREMQNEEVVGWLNYRIADIYRELRDHERMLEFAKICSQKFDELYASSGRRQHKIGTARAKTILAAARQAKGDLDEALELNRTALEMYRGANDGLGETRAITDIGRILARLGQDAEAEKWQKEGLALRRKLGHKTSQTSNLLELGELYLGRGDHEAALAAFDEALSIANETGVKMRAYQAHESLSRAYSALGRLEDSYEHFREFHRLKEELAGEAMSIRIHNTKVLAEIARAEREAELERARSEELKAKNDELARLLDELKATQDRLIQSEKMASLGQLTAGIAHEIRNPLNFVNNFSELSAEIVEEMNDVLTRCSSRMPDREREELRESLETLVFNTSKIREHGIRADGIVKSMLQHSRTGTAVVEATDVNELLDEYLNLAYHGMRARQSDFNVTLETDYDEAVGLVEVIPQDLGRVFLNLISNAFDALHEHGAQGGSDEPDEPDSPDGPEGPDIQPTVRVATHRDGQRVEVTISDNGPGIPQDVRDRIFEPFFTTKPPGSGTGLGLSMSYDIITKGHNGELEVISEPGLGATFVIRLPAPER